MVLDPSQIVLGRLYHENILLAVHCKREYMSLMVDRAKMCETSIPRVR
jgi:hypothetical protein